MYIQDCSNIEGTEYRKKKEFAAETTGLPGGYSGVCRCRDCRYLEIDHDTWKDGTRRCSWKGEWVRPGREACYKFEGR